MLACRPTTTPFACITYTIIISYAMTIFSWVFLFLLPRQKEETQELARTGGSNKILGGITIFYLAFSLVWSITVNTLAVFDSTSCLVIELAAKLPVAKFFTLKCSVSKAMTKT